MGMGNALVYWPDNNNTRTIMQKAVKIAGLDLPDQKFNSEKEAIQVARDNTSVYFGAVIFDNVDGQSAMPKHIKYSIRMKKTLPAELQAGVGQWQTRLIYPPYQMPGA